MSVNINYPSSSRSVRDEAFSLFDLFINHQIPDPSIPLGDPSIDISRNGQKLSFHKTNTFTYPFRVMGFININSQTGKWQSQSDGGVIGNSHTGSGGTAFQKKSSFVEVYGGYVNNMPVKIGGKNLLDDPYRKDIDAELFANNTPIGVALYCGVTKANLMADKYDPVFTLKFHSVSGVNTRGTTLRYKKLYDEKWLWKGTRVRGRGKIASGVPQWVEESQWAGAGENPQPVPGSVGRVLLAIITPPPVQFIQIVTRNLSHGIYCSQFGAHRHIFF